MAVSFNAFGITGGRKERKEDEWRWEKANGDRITGWFTRSCALLRVVISEVC